MTMVLILTMAVRTNTRRPSHHHQWHLHLHLLRLPKRWPEIMLYQKVWHTMPTWKKSHPPPWALESKLRMHYYFLVFIIILYIDYKKSILNLLSIYLSGLSCFEWRLALYKATQLFLLAMFSLTTVLSRILIPTTATTAMGSSCDGLFITLNNFISERAVNLRRSFA